MLNAVTDCPKYSLIWPSMTRLCTINRIESKRGVFSSFVECSEIIENAWKITIEMVFNLTKISKISIVAAVGFEKLPSNGEDETTLKFLQFERARFNCCVNVVLLFDDFGLLHGALSMIGWSTKNENVWSGILQLNFVQNVFLWHIFWCQLIDWNWCLWTLAVAYWCASALNIKINIIRLLSNIANLEDPYEVVCLYSFKYFKFSLNIFLPLAVRSVSLHISLL